MKLQYNTSPESVPKLHEPSVGTFKLLLTRTGSNNDFSDIDTPRTSITSFSPLQMHDLDHQPQDAEDDILLPGKLITSEHRTVGSSSKRPAWVALGLPVKLRACIASASIYGPPA
jgi:hypothetical protein